MMPRLLRPRRGQSAFALVLVLLVVALLAVLVADMASSAWLSRREARNYTQDAQYAAATDGVLRMLGGTLFDPDTPLLTRLNIVQEGLHALPVGDTVVDVVVEDENGKLNVNAPASGGAAAAQAWRKELAALCSTIGAGPDLAAAIPKMAVSPGLSGASATKRVAFLEELRALRGVTEQTLYGDAGKPETLDRALGRFMTTWGPGLVNVNTATPEVLRAVLSGVATGLADQIVRGRALKPYESIDEVLAMVNADSATQARLRGRLTTAVGVCQVTVISQQDGALRMTRAILEPGARQRGVVRICRRCR